MRAELIPVDGGPPIPITRDVTVIGRREYCDIQLDDPSLSKRHCVLVKTDGLLMIRDLATTNGTRVKGQRIRWAALLPERPDHDRQAQVSGLPRPRWPGAGGPADAPPGPRLRPNLRARVPAAATGRSAAVARRRRRRARRLGR